MHDCIFCKIIDGSVPCMKIYEDEYTFSFMDIAKDVDGHILVVPKVHKKNILDCDEETLINLMRTVKKISNHWPKFWGVKEEITEIWEKIKL